MLQSVFMGIGLAMDASCVSMTNGLVERRMKVMKIIMIALVFGIFQSLMPILGYFIGSYFSKYIDKFIPLIALIVLTILGGKMIIETLREKKHNTIVPQIKGAESTEEAGGNASDENTADASTEVMQDAQDSKTEEKADAPEAESLSDAVVEDTDAQSEETTAEEETDVRKIRVKEIIVQAIATSIDAFSVGVLFVAEKTSFAMISFALFGIITALMCVGATFIGKKFGAVFKDKAGIIGGVILILIGLKIFIEYMVQTY